MSSERPATDETAGADVASAIELACRAEYGRITSVLVRVLGSLEEAEDVLQSAFAIAISEWRRRGVPSRPAAWLTTVAKRLAIDVVRRRRSSAGAADRVERDLRAGYNPVARKAVETDDPYELLARWPDERLKLIFLCCHPVLDVSSRIALTLREVCGLSTAAVARTFLVSEAAMGRRLSRAKRRIRESGASFELPSGPEFADRLEDVLAVVYLLFNEGYLPRDSSELISIEACDEAIHLGRVVTGLLDGDTGARRAEPLGLLALMILTHSRRLARVGPDGLPVLLDEQDRAAWVDAEAREGLALLDRAIACRAPGPYQLKAAIAALHHTAVDAEDTDWEQIHALYEELYSYEPTPVVRLNAAVALGMWKGPEAALEALGAPGPRPDEISPPAAPDTTPQPGVGLSRDLADYPYYHLAVARFLEEAGRIDEAQAALARAAATSTNEAERRFVRHRIDELSRRRAR